MPLEREDRTIGVFRTYIVVKLKPDCVAHLKKGPQALKKNSKPACVEILVDVALVTLVGNPNIVAAAKATRTKPASYNSKVLTPKPELMDEMVRMHHKHECLLHREICGAF